MDLLVNEKVERLYEEKGVNGLGIYLRILCMMYKRESSCLTITRICKEKMIGASQKSTIEVVRDYGLFEHDGRGHITSALDFHNTKVNENENSKSIQNEFEINSVLYSPARINRELELDIEKYHRLNDISDDDDGDDDDEAQPVVTKDDYISQIPRESEWTEVAMMRSRFGPLIMRNWEVALGEFRKHVIANCSAERIRSLEDAKRYFLYYVTNPTSGTLLRKALEEHERRNPTQNTYRFEDPDSGPGNRRYNGIPLPDDAPPRPDERCDWDYVTHSWITI